MVRAMDDEEEGSGPDLTLLLVHVCHPRGRPSEPAPQRPQWERPPISVMSAICPCLRYDEVTEAGEVCEELPLYCRSCHRYFLVEGAADVSLDIALLHLLWWVWHMKGLSERVEQRVTD